MLVYHMYDAFLYFRFVALPYVSCRSSVIPHSAAYHHFLCESYVRTYTYVCVLIPPPALGVVSGSVSSGSPQLSPQYYQYSYFYCYCYSFSYYYFYYYYCYCYYVFYYCYYRCFHSRCDGLVKTCTIYILQPIC